MFDSSALATFIARLPARRRPAEPRRADPIGATIMSRHSLTVPSPARRRPRGLVTAVAITLLVPTLLSAVPLFGLGGSAALACACGCSVFDVGGLNTPQEQDHGGRVFFEFWSSDQNQNWVGDHKAPASINTDKRLNTQWYAVGFEYMFNRQWGVMVRAPMANRAFTTQTDDPFPGAIQTFNARDIGDMEVMGMYTGFFNDMSTGVIFGIKLPTGPYTTPGFDRDNQIGSGSTDLILGGFHRGLITGDNAWQYFMQIRAQIPFFYRSAIDPDTGLDELYKPAPQIDGAAGVIYNNLYNVLGFDKITPLAQVIISHRDHDSGPAADPFNSGFDRVMLSPGIEFTKVLDEANNRVLKTYFDVEIPVYYRVNAANNGGTEGQLIAPYLVKAIVSYNF